MSETVRLPKITKAICLLLCLLLGSGLYGCSPASDSTVLPESVESLSEPETTPPTVSSEQQSRLHPASRLKAARSRQAAQQMTPSPIWRPIQNRTTLIHFCSS